MVDDDEADPMRSLPPLQRLVRYRQLADDTLRLAARTANRETRAQYLMTIARWHALAAAAEKEIAETAPPPLSPAKDGDDRPER